LSIQFLNKLDCVLFIQDVLHYTDDEIMVEPYEEVVGKPHYNTSSSRSSSPVAEEDWSIAETFKGPIVNSSRGVEITVQTGSVASAAWPSWEAHAG